jgi:hypothetical protein
METNKEYKLVPDFGYCFGTGWRVMMDNFLRLFVVILIVVIITAPFKMFNFHFNWSDLSNGPWNWEHGWWHNWYRGPWNMGHDWGHNLIGFGTLGIFAAFFGLLAMLYSFLVKPVEYLIKGFIENYLHIILANLLVIALVVLGLFALIVPGIIIACRLAFVSYIIMDKKLDPIEAVELSWKLTKGHGWQVFLMGFVSFFIAIFGLCLLFVGIFPALMWIGSSFAALYESVLREKEKPAEAVAA